MLRNTFFLWKGINTAPASTIDDPTIQLIATLSSHTSLCDSASYWSGLCKFHIFCNIFSIPESNHLPAALPLLHSFALWAAADPSLVDSDLLGRVPFKPVSVTVVKKYLTAIQAWHIVQGWPPPLSNDGHDHISWSLCGLENIQGNCKHPIYPPITLNMLHTVQASLNINEPFDACVWAMALCAFWGWMHFWEVSVTTQSTFSKAKNLTHRDAHFGFDQDSKPYAHLNLPSSKAAKPGENQSIFLVPQDGLCPLSTLWNLTTIVPAGPDDPLFSWRDKYGTIQPMVKLKAINCINSIIRAWGWGTTFGHSFQIGGASYYLSQKVSPEIVWIARCWKSLAYEVYIRVFEQVASHHIGGLLTQLQNEATSLPPP